MFNWCPSGTVFTISLWPSMIDELTIDLAHGLQTTSVGCHHFVSRVENPEYGQPAKLMIRASMIQPLFCPIIAYYDWCVYIHNAA